MKNEFWTIFYQKAKLAEKKSAGLSDAEYTVAYMDLKRYIDEHTPLPPIVWKKP